MTRHLPAVSRNVLKRWPRQGPWLSPKRRSWAVRSGARTPPGTMDVDRIKRAAASLAGPSAARRAGTGRRARPGHEVWHALGRALWRHRWRTLAALVLLILAKLLMVAVPGALKAIVDALSQPPELLTLPALLLAGYALLRFAGGLFTELRDMVFARVTQSMVAGFKLRVFSHLHALDVRFHASRQ